MPAKRRRNGEGSWGKKSIKGVSYLYYRKPYNGVDKYFYGKTEKEIKAKVKTFEESNTIIISKDIKTQTFGDYITYWLETVHQPSIKRRTFDNYEDIVRVQIVNYKNYDIGNKQMGSLDEDIFRDYYNDMAKVYARGTIKKNYAIVSLCLDYATTNKHVPKNFLEQVSIPSEDLVKTKKKEVEFLYESDMEKLYQECNRINVKGFNFGGKLGEPVYGINAYAVVFIMYTGLRIGELMSLEWQDINLDKKTIFINKSMSSIKNRDKKDNKDKKYVKEDTDPKTYSSTRTIPLSDRAIEMLNLMSEKNPNHKPTDKVCTNLHGNSVNRSNVTRTLHSMLKRANCEVEECGLHSLRHSFGSYLLLHKVDIKIVSTLLGHKDITVTYNTYIHLINQQKVEAVNVFDKIDNKDESE